MKNTMFRRLCMTMMWVLASLPAWGQGTIDFRNFGTSWAAPWFGGDGGPTDKIVYFDFGPCCPYEYNNERIGNILLAGTGYTVELWAGPEGSSVIDLQVLAHTTFRTGNLAGLIQNPSSAVAVPFATPGQRVTVQVRVWDNRAGMLTTWQQALQSSGYNYVNTSELFLTPPLLSGSPVTLDGMNSYTFGFADGLRPYYQGQRLPVISVNTGSLTNYYITGYTNFYKRGIAEGETVTLSVECPPPGAQIQWTFAGTSIEGATNRQLVLTNIQPSQTGFYTAVATTNFINGTRVARMTNSVHVAVTGRLRLDNPQITMLTASSNRFTATVAGIAYRYVWIETSSNLQAWVPQQQVFASIVYSNIAPRTNHQFYRARIVP